MPRYIDADELYETVTKKYSDIVAGCYPYNIVAYDMARLVKEAPTADVAPRSEVIEEYRQKVNTKMGKHTHLLGKEYVQRILREVAKEMKGE